MESSSSLDITQGFLGFLFGFLKDKPVQSY